MKQYISQQKNTVSELKSTDVIGFLKQNEKGFVQWVRYEYGSPKNPMVKLVSVNRLHKSNGWLDESCFSEAVLWLKEIGSQIFVFENEKELLRWLSE